MAPEPAVSQGDPDLDGRTSAATELERDRRAEWRFAAYFAVGVALAALVVAFRYGWLW